MKHSIVNCKTGTIPAMTEAEITPEDKKQQEQNCNISCCCGSKVVACSWIGKLPEEGTSFVLPILKESEEA